MKVVVFGAGNFGKKWCCESADDAEVVAVIDNNSQKWGGVLCGHKILEPSELKNLSYDKVIVAVDDFPDEGRKNLSEILRQLSDYGVKHSDIFLPTYRFSAGYPHDPRIDFLRKYSSIVQEHNISGAVAECGVWRGSFAGQINKLFPDRKLYLFDTFGDGFDQRDLDKEPEHLLKTPTYEALNEWGVHADATVSLLRCPYPENVIIKSGYVPETFQGLEDEKFAFVNLDMDLYQPQIEALRFFAPRMEQGGIILVHEYYHTGYVSVKAAVDDFAKEFPVALLPTEDSLSVAVVPLSKK